MSLTRLVCDSQAKHLELSITRERLIVKSRLFCCFGWARRSWQKNIRAHLLQTEHDRDANLEGKSKGLLEDGSFAELRAICSLSLGHRLGEELLQYATPQRMCLVVFLTFAAPSSSALDICLIAAVMQSLNVATAHDCYAVHHGEARRARARNIVDKGILQLLRVSACKSPFSQQTRLKINRYCFCSVDTTVLAACQQQQYCESSALSAEPLQPRYTSICDNSTNISSNR